MELRENFQILEQRAWEVLLKAFQKKYARIQEGWSAVLVLQANWSAGTAGLSFLPPTPYSKKMWRDRYLVILSCTKAPFPFESSGSL